MTQDKLKKSISYNQITGEFRRLIGRPHSPVGSIVGCVNTSGYLVIRVDGKLYYAHRLAWLYVYGEWPHDVIDHSNGDKSDNRLCNLRSCSQSSNGGNTKRAATNTSGFKGVSYFRQTRRWRAQIVHQKQHYSLGYYRTKEEASLAYAAKAVELFGEFARVS